MTTRQEYQIDDATFAHLTAWCDSNLPAEEATIKRDEMAQLLEASPLEDVEYWLAHGWWHIHDLL